MPALARVSDPASSYRAVRELQESGQLKAQRDMVLLLVLEHPGSTSFGLAFVSDHLDRYQVARRLADLEHMGLVEKRENPKGPHEDVVWYPVSEKAQGSLF